MKDLHETSIRQVLLAALLTAMLLVTALAAPSASNAGTGFERERVQEYGKAQRDFRSMDRAINAMLDRYLAWNEEAPLTWSDDILIGHYQDYLDSLASYQEGLGGLWRSIKESKLRTRRVLERFSRRSNPRSCEPRSFRKAKRLLGRSHSHRRSATTAFREARTAMSGANRMRDMLNGLSIDLAERINDRPTTDGFEDDAVYAFGTPIVILPGPGPDFDPNDFTGIVDSLFAYDNYAIDVFETSVYRHQNRAVAAARKAGTVASRCG